jgi:hypothetical protein
MKSDRPRLRIVSGSDALTVQEKTTETPEDAIQRDWAALDKRATARVQELWPHDNGALARTWADALISRGIDYLIAAGFPVEEIPQRCSHYIIRRLRERRGGPPPDG